MQNPKLCALALAVASAYASTYATVAYADDAAPDAPPSSSTSASEPLAPVPPADVPADVPAAAPVTPVGPSQAPRTLDAVQITAHKLDAARSQLSPETGSSIYRFSEKDIAQLPLGSSTPLNQVVLQAPGAVQDSYGQLHVRGDHANLQYRINGVVIPEAISGFGQGLSTHFADHISILTGALPAQYGYRTAGIIDIQTKGSVSENTGSVTVMGGSHGDREVSGDITGGNQDWSYFLTGSYQQNDLGIENPTPDRNALHDHTKQSSGFGVVSRIIDSSSRVSLMFGSSNNKFQIPNVPGQTPTYTLDGAPPIDSSDFNARQDEKNSFQVLTYQASPGDKTDYQVSAFHRYTDVHYQPDPVGDLTYNGIAADILRKNEAYGVQGDMSFRLNDQHTIRSGVFVQRERFAVDNTSQVFPADADGNQLSGVPLTIVDNTHLTGQTWGVYLQDEWQPTKDLTINYGARYDHVNTVVNEQQLSPRIGLVYDLSPVTRLHIGYARYFTPPPTEKIDTTSVAKFIGTTNALPSDANTAVKSERSHYFDVGLSHQLTSTVTIGVDAYYRKVKNLQDEGQFGNALIYSAFNYDQGRVKGVEFSTSYRKDDLSAYVNLSLSRAEGKNIVTGQFNFDQDELDYIASHWVHLDHDQQVSVSAGASYKWGATTFGGDMLYGSGLRSGFANSEHLPSYTTANLSAVHNFNFASVGKVDVRVALLNIADKVYELRDGTGIGVGAPQFGPRRSIYAGVTKNF